MSWQSVLGVTITLLSYTSHDAIHEEYLSPKTFSRKRNSRNIKVKQQKSSKALSTSKLGIDSCFFGILYYVHGYRGNFT